MSKFKEAIQSETPTLVDFYATWCGPCQAMMPVLDQVKAKMGNQVRILKIDIDKNIEIAEKFKIRSVPSFILFKNGEIKFRQTGGMDAASMVKKIKSAL